MNICNDACALELLLVGVCVRAQACKQCVSLWADSSQGDDLFLRLEAEAAQCLMSAPGRGHGRVWKGGRGGGEGGDGWKEGCSRICASFQVQNKHFSPMWTIMLELGCELSHIHKKSPLEKSVTTCFPEWTSSFSPPERTVTSNQHWPEKVCGRNSTITRVQAVPEKQGDILRSESDAVSLTKPP